MFPTLRGPKRRPTDGPRGRPPLVMRRRRIWLLVLSVPLVAVTLLSSSSAEAHVTLAVSKANGESGLTQAPVLVSSVGVTYDGNGLSVLWADSPTSMYSEGYEGVQTQSTSSSSPHHCGEEHLNDLGVLNRNTRLRPSGLWWPSDCGPAPRSVPAHYFRFQVSELSRVRITPAANGNEYFVHFKVGGLPASSELIDDSHGKSRGIISKDGLPPGVYFMIVVHPNWNRQEMFAFDLEIDKPKERKPTISDALIAQFKRQQFDAGWPDDVGRTNNVGSSNETKTVATPEPAFEGFDFAKIRVIDACDRPSCDEYPQWLREMGNFSTGVLFGQRFAHEQYFNPDGAAYKLGWTISGLLVVGDIRDIVACGNAQSGCSGTDLLITGVGFVPWFGDSVKIVRIVKKSPKGIDEFAKAFSRMNREQKIALLDMRYGSAGTRSKNAQGFDKELRELGSGGDRFVGSDRVFRLLAGKYKDYKVLEFRRDYYDATARHRGDFDVVALDPRGRLTIIESHSARDPDLLRKAKILVDEAKATEGGNIIVDFNLFNTVGRGFQRAFRQDLDEFANDIGMDPKRLRLNWIGD